MADQAPPQIDTLFQTYNRNLYKITGQETEDEILNSLQSNPQQNNSASVNIDPSTIGSGVITTTLQQATGSMQQGKKLFTDSVEGYILGVDPKDGLAKFSIGNTDSFLQWDGVTLTTTGTIEATGFVFNDSTGATVMQGGGSVSASNYVLLITPTATTNNGVYVNTGVGGIGYFYTNTANVASRGGWIQQTSTGMNNVDPALEIDMGGSAEALFCNISGSGFGIQVARTAGTGTSALVKIFDSLATAGQAMLIQRNNASGSGTMVQIQNDGSGITVSISGTNSSNPSLYVEATNGSASNALQVVHNGTGNSAVLVQKTSSGATVEIAQTANNGNACYGLKMSVQNSGVGKPYAFYFGGSETAASGVGGSQSAKIKVSIAGTDYFIPCYTA